MITVPIISPLPDENTLMPHFSVSLQGGSLGECDTASAWVHLLTSSGTGTLDPSAEILKAFQRTGPDSDFLDTYRKDLTRWEVSLKQSPEYLITSSVTIHEETHFYQLVGSPFGRLLSEFDRVFSSDIANYTRELVLEIGLDSLPLPLGKWVEDEVPLTQNVQDLKGLVALSFVQSLGIKYAFFGTKPRTLDGLSFDEVCSIRDAIDLWIWYQVAVDRLEGAGSEQLIQQTTHPREIQTRLALDEPTCPSHLGITLTPREIFEGVALELQLAWLREFVGDRQDSLPTVLRLVNPGFVHPQYLATRRLIAQTWPQLPWPQRRSLLFTLSDLALCGPTHNDYLASQSEVIYWEDIHPGYRFKRSLQALSESDLRITGDIEEDYGVICDFVCNTLRWTPPHEMAQNFLANTRYENHSFSYRDPLFATRQRAASARLVEPTFFAAATNETTIHEQYDLKLPFIVERGGLRMPNEEERYRALLHAAILKAAQDLYLNESIRPIFTEPEAVRQPVYEMVWDFYFGHRNSDARPLDEFLRPAPSTIEREFVMQQLHTSTDESIASFLKTLRQQGLTVLADHVELQVLLQEPSAKKWYVQQPNAVRRILDLRTFEENNAFSISKSDLYAVLAEFRDVIDDEFFELVEDVGFFYGIRDLKEVHELVGLLGGMNSTQQDTGEHS